MGNEVDSYESKEILLVITVDYQKPANQIELDRKVNDIIDKKINPRMP
jgi:hypothetical protein